MIPQWPPCAARSLPAVSHDQRRRKLDVRDGDTARDEPGSRGVASMREQPEAVRRQRGADRYDSARAQIARWRRDVGPRERGITRGPDQQAARQPSRSLRQHGLCGYSGWASTRPPMAVRRGISTDRGSRWWSSPISTCRRTAAICAFPPTAAASGRFGSRRAVRTESSRALRHAGRRARATPGCGPSPAFQGIERPSS